MSLSTAIVMKRPFRAHGSILGKFLVAGCLGVLLGLFVTIVEIEHGKGFVAIEAGPWTGWPRSEASVIDPFSRAILVYSGKIAL
ncbi:MAG: hypothetical protein ACLPKT_22885, partial [Methylocella sp.]